MSTITKITAWSFSRYNEYMRCPRKAFYKFVKRMPEPGNKAMDRGDQIHKALEAFLKGTTRTLPKDVHKDLKPYYTEVKKLKPRVEMEIAFDQGWNKVDWFAKNCWVRVKVDALVEPVADDEAPRVRVIDHKTGQLKDKGEYDEQLELYGLAGLKLYPIAKEAVGELAFTDHGQIIDAGNKTPVVYLRKDESKLQKKWDTRVKRMMADTRFDPTPGRQCSYCHFRKSNGGPCEF